MFVFKKKKCTEETIGFIKKKRWNGDLWFLTVEYSVDGNITKKHKIGSIPVGVHASSTIENIEVGASIRVRYNPNKPKQSYLPENNGYHIS